MTVQGMWVWRAAFFFAKAWVDSAGSAGHLLAQVLAGASKKSSGSTSGCW